MTSALRHVTDDAETLTRCAIERAYVDKGTAAMTRKIHAASSSPARSAASLKRYWRKGKGAHAFTPEFRHDVEAPAAASIPLMATPR